MYGNVFAVSGQDLFQAFIYCTEPSSKWKQSVNDLWHEMYKTKTTLPILLFLHVRFSTGTCI